MASKRMIDPETLPNIEITCSNGNKYLLLPYEHLDDVPMVDAVEVNCHECQSHTEDPETGKHYCWKPLGCMGCIQVNPDDFCSRGKRKEREK